MIAFDLRCSNGHSFEGWFNDLESFNEQDSRDMIICPVCKSNKITRELSPVAIKSVRGEEEPQQNKPDYRKLAMGVMEYIRNNFEDVGADFAKEALKIHYGVAEKRDIRGSATDEEEKTLKDEGVKFFKFPFFKPKDEDS
ncbi:MAG: DUF1178 family protein [Deltaproteobacteria bacterium]|nr:MAG: DUF1178 family protein [Deltaproteobacteria bacterium]UCH07514.1 MAG: DUF1178 family protein [Deltaproteobacteria bacterium]